jgi:hypothetical protein
MARGGRISSFWFGMEFETLLGGAEAAWRHGQALDAMQRLLESLDRQAGLSSRDEVD